MDPNERQKLENAKAYISPEQIQDVYFEGELQAAEERGKIAIKLIVSALGLKQPKQFFRNRLGKISGIAKLGTVHTAVQMGPVIAEWDMSELVYITPSVEYNNFRAIAVLDLKVMDLAEFRKEYLPDICSIIAKWNGTKRYSEANNCQIFSEEILKKLQIDSPFNGNSKIKKFMDSLEDLDKRSVPFSFQLKNKTYTFASHRELDQFCKDHERDLTPEDCTLLKAFDRVYWLRYYAATLDPDLPEDKKKILVQQFSPLSLPEARGDQTTDCYFHDPSQSATMWAPSQGRAEDDSGVNHDF